MKMQYLFLPLILWTFIVIILLTVPPSSLFIVLGFIVIVSLTTYITMRAMKKTKLALIGACSLCLLLTSSILTGFSPINFALIIAITVVVSFLVAGH